MPSLSTAMWRDNSRRNNQAAAILNAQRRERKSRVVRAFCSRLKGVCTEDDEEGDLTVLRDPKNHVRGSFGQVDLTDLRTQALFAGGDNEDEEDEDESGSDDDGDDENDDGDGDEDAETDHGKLMRLSRYVVVPGAGYDVADILWLLEHHWNLQRPGALLSISGGMKTDDMHPLLAQVAPRPLRTTHPLRPTHSRHRPHAATDPTLRPHSLVHDDPPDLAAASACLHSNAPPLAGHSRSHRMLTAVTVARISGAHARPQRGHQPDGRVGDHDRPQLWRQSALWHRTVRVGRGRAVHRLSTVVGVCERRTQGTRGRGSRWHAREDERGLDVTDRRGASGLEFTDRPGVVVSPPRAAPFAFYSRGRRVAQLGPRVDD
jgi:hypothetical protein